MNGSHTRKVAIGVTALALIVCAAAFVPWGAGSSFSPITWGRHQFAPVQTYPTYHVERPASGGQPRVAVTWPKSMTAWNGYVALGRLKFPNWLVVVAAGGVLVLCWLKAFSVGDRPSVLPMVLAVYGFLHAVVVPVFVPSAKTIVPGGLLTAAAFLGIQVMLVVQRMRRQAEPNKTLNPSGNGGRTSG